MGDAEPRWVGLILALEFAAERTQTPLPTFRAPEMFKNLLAQLSADTEALDRSVALTDEQPQGGAAR